ncbi:hypothetical protein BGZ83_004859 [Gryganskiella cystojenkinii]|nr:hypothetical protein BGZ83_004859 [Gryganskiella cystojenkinii]
MDSLRTTDNDQGNIRSPPTTPSSSSTYFAITRPCPLSPHHHRHQRQQSPKHLHSRVSFNPPSSRANPVRSPSQKQRTSSRIDNLDSSEDSALGSTSCLSESDSDVSVEMGTLSPHRVRPSETPVRTISTPSERGPIHRRLHFTNPVGTNDGGQEDDVEDNNFSVVKDEEQEDEYHDVDGNHNDDGSCSEDISSYYYNENRSKSARGSRRITVLSSSSSPGRNLLDRGKSSNDKTSDTDMSDHNDPNDSPNHTPHQYGRRRLSLSGSQVSPAPGTPSGYVPRIISPLRYRSSLTSITPPRGVGGGKSRQVGENRYALDVYDFTEEEGISFKKHPQPHDDDDDDSEEYGYDSEFDRTIEDEDDFWNPKSDPTESYLPSGLLEKVEQQAHVEKRSPQATESQSPLYLTSPTVASTTAATTTTITITGTNKTLAPISRVRHLLDTIPRSSGNPVTSTAPTLSGSSISQTSSTPSLSQSWFTSLPSSPILSRKLEPVTPEQHTSASMSPTSTKVEKKAWSVPQLSSTTRTISSRPPRHWTRNARAQELAAAKQSNNISVNTVIGIVPTSSVFASKIPVPTRISSSVSIFDGPFVRDSSQGKISRHLDVEDETISLSLARISPTSATPSDFDSSYPASPTPLRSNEKVDGSTTHPGLDRDNSSGSTSSFVSIGRKRIDGGGISIMDTEQGTNTVTPRRAVSLSPTSVIAKGPPIRNRNIRTRMASAPYFVPWKMHMDGDQTPPMRLVPPAPPKFDEIEKSMMDVDDEEGVDSFSSTSVTVISDPQAALGLRSPFESIKPQLSVFSMAKDHNDKSQGTHLNNKGEESTTG